MIEYFFWDLIKVDLKLDIIPVKDLEFKTEIMIFGIQI